jgi:hypothetical protein
MRKSIGSCALALAMTAVVVGCSDSAAGPPETLPGDYHYSFESGLEGWTASATDTVLGGGGIPWWIRPVTSHSFEGSRSLEFYLGNYNDAGKIWIVRPITVSPNSPYRVTISYAFGTADWGQANLFSLLTGVTLVEPRTSGDLANTLQGDTGNGASNDVGYLWIDKRLELDVTSSADGRLYVVVGVWGTWEGPRTYYVDALQLQVVPI